jgi:hypothetical protein
VDRTQRNSASTEDCIDSLALSTGIEARPYSHFGLPGLLAL